MTLDAAPSRVADVATRVTSAVARHYGTGARTERLSAAMSALTTDRREIDADRLSVIEATGQQVFRHLELSLADNLVAQDHSPGWPPPDIPAIRRSGAMVESVERSPDGTATIRFTGLAAAPAAGPLLRAAFALAGDAEAVVLDLRANGGGDPATLVLIVDWLIGEASPRHLFDVVYRDRVRQWWTTGVPLGPRPSGAVTALIGPGTYSSGEALAWVLQTHQLATLVGQRTPGAADHVVPLALTHDVEARIPEARVVAPDGGHTWEGTGVRPDVTAPGDPPS